MHQKFVIIIGRSVSIKSSKKNIVMIDSVLMNMWIQNVITAMTVLRSLSWLFVSLCRCPAIYSFSPLSTVFLNNNKKF